MPKRVPNVRIVGGKFRGVKIPYKSSSKIRPTSNRNRETLFNWLGDDIKGATCLDMFAGTGALGFEAISRGAKFVYFSEKSRKLCSGIKETVKKLNLETQTDIINTNSLVFPFKDRIKDPVDIIFIDPPFRKELVERTIRKVEEQKIISKSSMIYMELEIEKKIDEMQINWNLIKSKSGGQTRYCLFSIK